ncbi:MAG TPA: DUF1059 domain-containing protein [Geobacteraceae bacterium]|nr:DUF1059 domain-containing protein [Geobacteraceae bacterium]
MKAVSCARVDPSSGCTSVITGMNEEDLLNKVAVHAREHNIREVTPELLALVKANIYDV